MKMLRDMQNKIMNSIARAIVTNLVDTGGIQVCKARVLDGEELEDIERVQNYGLASNPGPDAQAVIVFIGGDRNYPIIISADKPAARFKSLAAGEAAFYSSATNYLHAKANGKMELKTSELTALGLTKLIFDEPIEFAVDKITIKNAAGDDLIDLLHQLATFFSTAQTTSPGNLISTAASAVPIVTKILAFKA